MYREVSQQETVRKYLNRCFLAFKCEKKNIFLYCVERLNSVIANDIKKYFISHF